MEAFHFTPAMLKLRAMRVRCPLVRECMAEFLGTFVLMVSDFELDCNFQNQSNGFLKKKKKSKLENSLEKEELKCVYAYPKPWTIIL